MAAKQLFLGGGRGSFPRFLPDVMGSMLSGSP